MLQLIFIIIPTGMDCESSYVLESREFRPVLRWVTAKPYCVILYSILSH